MDKQHWPVMPDALPYVLIGVIITVIVYYAFGLKAALLPVVLVLFVLFFFRNPERSAGADYADVLSTADGVVMGVEEVEETRYLKGPAIKVSIFLNIFNVHVNRSPIAGRVNYISYQPGKFFPAFKSHASTLNERNYVGIRNEDNPALSLLVVQITGFVARRVVCWVKEGDLLKQGQRFGLIRFGSCTEVYLPQGAEISVQKGSKVRGGETIIGRLRDEEKPDS